MTEDNTDTLNLDLGLGSIDNSTQSRSISNPRISSLENMRHEFLLRQVQIPSETQFLDSVSENANGFAESKKKNDEKNNGDKGSFFDCNICLDLAKDPVVTCCGHLFCWSCIYRWLDHRSCVKECPVCKGEVTVNTVTPIYGCGNNLLKRDTNSSSNIPLRPQARRIESTSNQTCEIPQLMGMINEWFRNRNSPVRTENLQRWRRTPAVPSGESRVAANAAAVLQSVGGMMDNLIEMESNAILSTLSSRRRNEISQMSDMDGVDSPAPQRRRLTE